MTKQNGANQRFRYFMLGSFSALLGSEMFVFLLPVLLFSLGYSPIVVGYSSFLFFAPAIAGKLLLGPILERVNKRLVLLSVEAGRLATAGFLAIGLFFFSDSALVFILVSAFIAGTLCVFADTAEPAVLKILVHDRDNTSALSIYEVRTRVAQLIGPALAGVLLSLAISVPLGGCLLLALFAFVLYSRVSVPNTLAPGGQGILSDLADAIYWMRNHRKFLALVLLTAINNLIHPILYLAVLAKLHVDGFDPEFIGVVLGGLGLGGIVGSMFAPQLKEKLTLEGIVLWVNILRIVVFTGFALTADPVFVFVLFVLKAVLGGTWNVYYSVFTLTEMPQELVARLSAISSFIVKSCTAAGSLLAGYLIAFLGFSGTHIILVGITILMFLGSFCLSADGGRRNN